MRLERAQRHKLKPLYQTLNTNIKKMTLMLIKERKKVQKMNRINKNKSRKHEGKGTYDPT